MTNTHGAEDASLSFSMTRLRFEYWIGKLIKKRGHAELVEARVGKGLYAPLFDKLRVTPLFVISPSEFREIYNSA